MLPRTQPLFFPLLRAPTGFDSAELYANRLESGFLHRRLPKYREEGPSVLSFELNGEEARESYVVRERFSEQKTKDCRNEEGGSGDCGRAATALGDGGGGSGEEKWREKPVSAWAQDR